MEYFETVYDSWGVCLGTEYVNLEGLTEDTVKAIMHLIYLDSLIGDSE